MSDNNDEILDRLDADADGSILPIRPAQPPDAPAPSTSPPGPASHRLSSLRRDALLICGGALLMFALLVTIILIAARLDRGPSPAPRVDGVALGRAFVKPLAGALADGFDAYADAIHGGKTAADSDKTLKDTFHAARAKAFAEHAGPALLSIVEDGGEPKDDAQRGALERFHRDFAKGLRSR